MSDGGYDIVEVDDMATDNMHLFVVYRRDVVRILEIATSFGLDAKRPLDYWSRLGAA